MLLSGEQFAQHLQRKSLLPVYLIGGDEPLQKQECLDGLRKKSKDIGYTDRCVIEITQQKSWQSLLEAVQNRSLFSEQQLIELRLGDKKIDATGEKALLGYLQKYVQDHLLVINYGKIDSQAKKKKWYQAVQKCGAIISLQQPQSNALPKWIQQRLASKSNKQISLEAAKLIAFRTEGCLLSTAQEIDKLILLIEEPYIDVENIFKIVTDNAQYDVFSMLEQAYLGHTRYSLRMLHGLRQGGIEPILLFSGMMWDIRKLCTLANQLQTENNLPELFRRNRIWGQRQHAFKQILKRHSVATFNELLNYCAHIDRTIKSTYKDTVWDQFVVVLATLAGLNTKSLQRI